MHTLAIVLACPLVMMVIEAMRPGRSFPKAAQVSLIAGLAELFLHWNVNTPKWVGYFIQRPEAHCIHHKEGLHAYNYSELPVINWLFGTLREPGQ